MSRSWMGVFVWAVGCAGEPGPDARFDTADADGETFPSAPELEPGVNVLEMDQVVDGEMVTRTYRVHLPTTWDSGQDVPLLFAFHGAGGTGVEFVQQYGPAVEAGDVIGVYPDGINESWNIEREESTADDVAFVASILESLGEAEGLDTDRPVAVGFSNGAALAHKIAMESRLFAGIAPQGSQLLQGTSIPEQAAPVSVMQFHGTIDDVCPYDGGVGVLGYEFMAAEDSAAAWAAHNGCSASPSEENLDPHVRLEWEDCEDGRRVVHYRLEDVGHGVPPDVHGGTIPRVVEFLLQARD